MNPLVLSVATVPVMYQCLRNRQCYQVCCVSARKAFSVAQAASAVASLNSSQLFSAQRTRNTGITWIDMRLLIVWWLSFDVMWLAALYGCQTWSGNLRKEQKLRAFENRVLGWNLGLIERSWQEDGENYIMRSFIIFTLHQMMSE
jgi:hypothetical protein